MRDVYVFCRSSQSYNIFIVNKLIFVHHILYGLMLGNHFHGSHLVFTVCSENMWSRVLKISYYSTFDVLTTDFPPHCNDIHSIVINLCFFVSQSFSKMVFGFPCTFRKYMVARA